VIDGGIASNTVPLTAWSGQLAYGVSGNLSTWEGDNGSGSFNLQGVFTTLYRADVHPFVPTIDASPQPQTLDVSTLAAGSSGTFTSGSGSFTSSNSQSNMCQSCSISLGLASPQPTMVPLPSATNQFFVVPEASASPSGFSVPAPPPGCAAVCAFLYFADANAITCQATAGNPSYCDIVNGGTIFDEIAGDNGEVYLAPSFSLTLNPSTYALTVSATPAPLSLDPFGNPNNSATATLSGSFQVLATPNPMGVSVQRNR
jgi:hypothetical protein